jgi:ubiquinone/menaquinone biosynthesis C-methylase UbiE
MDENEIIRIVADSYNEIAKKYDAWRIVDKFNDLLEKFVSYLPQGGSVLDAGIGSGIPSARFLLDAGMKVSGVDISDTMLDMAKKNVPEAVLYKKNIMEVDNTFPENTFDGIISVFTLFHIPRKLHADVFEKFTAILKPSGILMINNGTSDSEGFSDFFGSTMFWSNFNPEKTLQLVKDAELEIIFAESLIRGGERQFWIFAKKPQ